MLVATYRSRFRAHPAGRALSRCLWLLSLHVAGWLVTTLGDTVVEQLSDEMLVALAIERGKQDQRPFQELYRRYHATVWRACFGIMRNHHDAEDMLQETFFKAYRNLHTFEHRSSFKTWIYRIALNNCRNKLRERQRRPQLSESEIDDMAERLPGKETVVGSFDQKAQQAQLAQALAALQPAEVELLQMKYMEKQKYQEIANTLDISVSAAKMRVQRARLALQQHYRELEHKS